MDDAELLYEDLFETLEDGKAIIKTSVHEMEDRIKELADEVDRLRLQVRNLQEQNDCLSKQNEILIRNISCLFKTAQMEIARKDKQIRSHQQQESLTSGMLPHHDTQNVHCPPRASSTGTRKLQPEPTSRNEGCKHGESTVMQSNGMDRRKESNSKTISTANNACKQTQRSSACHDVDATSNGRRDHANGMRKRRRDEESRHEYHSYRRRESEKYLVEARSGEPPPRHSHNVHRRHKSDTVK